MPDVSLRIEHLVLDTDNPRITHAAGQQEALQKVVRDQKTKLVRLAESIVEHGLSPIEKMMVLEVTEKPKRYIALEGNRRVAALKLLANPAVMTGLVIPAAMQKAIERLASVFDKSKVEPFIAHETASREEGRYWIQLRHNGEDEGRGVVAWKPIVAARYRDKEPAIQALDMVLEHISNGATPMPTPQLRALHLLYIGRMMGRVHHPRRFFQHITSQFEEIVRTKGFNGAPRESGERQHHRARSQACADVLAGCGRPLPFKTCSPGPRP
ncbi:hypothetical protein [Mesorhizobium carmichaelinearum]|uniref:hypothetical protein n=1 Tax=Mesorhizobium carmichaelinearum TaxID=1208188 RepID=UPI001180B1EF|nr:hypothetical protein [Mesorhizobium carmichaelinearum]